MTDNETTNDLIAAAAKAFQKPFAAVLKLEPEDCAPIWIDGRASPPTPSNAAPAGAHEACVWRAASETLMRVLEGERALESAYVSGRILISGDMSIMTRLKMETTR